MHQKKGFLHTSIQRSFSICCDFNTFHLEIDQLNDYPREKESLSEFN